MTNERITPRVGDGIACGDGWGVNVTQVAERLLCRTQSRGIGHGTREDADEGRSGCAREGIDHEGRHNAQCHNYNTEDIETLATSTEGGEEARAHLKADGIDEEYQAKLLEEVE